MRMFSKHLPLCLASYKHSSTGSYYLPIICLIWIFNYHLNSIFITLKRSILQRLFMYIVNLSLTILWGLTILLLLQIITWLHTHPPLDKNLSTFYWVRPWVVSKWDFHFQTLLFLLQHAVSLLSYKNNLKNILLAFHPPHLILHYYP